MNTDQIGKYRNRITNAALAWMKKKTGGNLIIVNIPGEKIETVEITEQVMNSLLLKFEGAVYSEFGRTEGSTAIKNAYQSAIEISKETEYLTESGKFIIDDLLMEVIQFVKQKHVKTGSKK